VHQDATTRDAVLRHASVLTVSDEIPQPGQHIVHEHGELPGQLKGALPVDFQVSP
jgi:hypothetical protein